MRILKYLTLCLLFSFWAFAISGTIQAHTNPQTVHRDDPMFLDEIVELKAPEKEVPEVPEVRLVTWSDPFAVREIIRNCTEEEWRLIESISIAEAGNQDIEGVADVQLVVFNRMELYGLTARQVIYAPNQFYTAGMSGGNELSAEARALVRSGWDESQGAIYFCSTGWNYYGDEHLFKHGDHYFSR